MSSRNKESSGSKLANNLLVVVIGLIASCIGIFTFITNIQSIPDALTNQSTTLPEPTQTPDITSLYTFFPTPIINSTRTYNFSVVYSDLSTSDSQQKTEFGSYSETVRIINDKYQSYGVTVVGVERIGGDYIVPCLNKFYWYVYDSNRFYIICSKNYVDSAGYQVANNKELNLMVTSQFEAETLDIKPVYLAPFVIDQQWQADYYITVQDKVTKITPLGTFYDCFKLRFFQIHYEEFRYVCPSVGVVAIEVSSRGDFYSAEIASQLPERR